MVFVCLGVCVYTCVHVFVCEWICVCVSGEGWIFCSVLIQVRRERVLKPWALCAQALSIWGRKVCLEPVGGHSGNLTCGHCVSRQRGGSERLVQEALCSLRGQFKWTFAEMVKKQRPAGGAKHWSCTVCLCCCPLSNSGIQFDKPVAVWNIYTPFSLNLCIAETVYQCFGRSLFI